MPDAVRLMAIQPAVIVTREFYATTWFIAAMRCYASAKRRRALRRVRIGTFTSAMLRCQDIGRRGGAQRWDAHESRHDNDAAHADTVIAVNKSDERVMFELFKCAYARDAHDAADTVLRCFVVIRWHVKIQARDIDDGRHMIVQRWHGGDTSRVLPRWRCRPSRVMTRRYARCHAMAST